MSTRPLRILVVDDDPAMVGAITALVGTEGHQVITAYDGLTAVKRFREEHPDLVLLDLAMPGPDGFTVAGRIRAEGDAPIVVVTGESSEEAKVRALGIGADDYLVKPFALPELLARIRALLRRGRPAETLRLQAVDLEMDLVARRVTRAGRMLDLTAREFELLEYLLRHQGHVVSREMLAHEVWKEPRRATPIDNVIDVQVARLRRKVDIDAHQRLIHTVRGVGFVLREGEP